MVAILIVQIIFLHALLVPQYLYLLLQIPSQCLGKLVKLTYVYSARIYKIQAP